MSGCLSTFVFVFSLSLEIRVFRAVWMGLVASPRAQSSALVTVPGPPCVLLATWPPIAPRLQRRRFALPRAALPLALVRLAAPGRVGTLARFGVLNCHMGAYGMVMESVPASGIAPTRDRRHAASSVSVFATG